MLIIEKQVVKFVRSKKYSPMKAEGLAMHFDIEDDEYEDFLSVLLMLERQGEIVKIKKEQYASPGKLGLVVGTLECKPKGFGFVIPAIKSFGDDIYVNEECMGSAMHGDLVVVRLPGKKDSRRKGRYRRDVRSESGKIIDIIEHVNSTVIGLLKKSRHLNYVVPDNPSLFKDIYVADEDLDGAEPGDKVIVKIINWPTRHLNPEGLVSDILGKEGDPGVDVKSIICQFKIPTSFSEKIVKELEAIPEKIPEKKYLRRCDLRNETIITIDPDEAKDFDDAVSLKREDNKWVLGVHIADVSHYVKPGSEIDHEAAIRGNSVYLPGEVIPMLPEKLSNNVCSLKEAEDRLTKTVFVTFDSYGKLLHSEIRKTVICTRKRFTYNEVTAILECIESNNIDVDREILDLIINIKELAELLFKNRMNRGSIELEIPEVDIRLDGEGNVAKVEKCVRDVSHGIIEEFMLVANEIAAECAGKNKLTCFYRVHDEPDEENLRDFASFIKSFKKVKIDPLNKKELQNVLEGVRGRPESYAINLMLLKSLMRAEYTIKQKEHYALSIENYTHFTSPIRRYPDLVIHRSLDGFLDTSGSKEKDSDNSEHLKRLASHCSFTERRAESAEKQVIKDKLIRSLEHRVNEDFDGIITGVEEYGFFVQLQENLLEGLVHVRTLVDDFYIYDKKSATLKGERRRKVFRIGDKVYVRLSNIDKIKKQVDFKVVKK